MSFDFASLEPSIRQILSAPGTDLRTISAKSVRKHLLDVHSSLTVEFIKTEKKAIDDVIGRVFGEISVEVGGVEPLVKEEGSGSREPGKRKRESSERNVYNGEDDEAEEDDEEQSDAAPSVPKKTKKLKKDNLMSDAELARQLQSEINGRSRRSTATNGSAKKAGRKKKSAALVETDDSSDGGESRKKSKTKKNPGGAKGGFAKEYALSEPLAALLEVEKLSRPQVVKKLWEYIKQRELQNPSNKREIICDGGLKAIFSVDKIDMFKMNKVLGQHLRGDDEQ